MEYKQKMTVFKYNITEQNSVQETCNLSNSVILNIKLLLVHSRLDQD